MVSVRDRSELVCASVAQSMANLTSPPCIGLAVELKYASSEVNGNLNYLDPAVRTYRYTRVHTLRKFIKRGNTQNLLFAQKEGICILLIFIISLKMANKFIVFDSAGRILSCLSKCEVPPWKVCIFIMFVHLLYVLLNQGHVSKERITKVCLWNEPL